MTTWLWGLRSLKFESLLGGFPGRRLRLRCTILAMINITPRQVPLTEGTAGSAWIRGPAWRASRGRGTTGVDSLNPGLSGTRFSYGAGR
ncbi:MAG: hypothetical protein R3F43_09655 [bacterium]